MKSLRSAEVYTQKYLYSHSGQPRSLQAGKVYTQKDLYSHSDLPRSLQAGKVYIQKYLYRYFCVYSPCPCHTKTGIFAMVVNAETSQSANITQFCYAKIAMKR